MNLIDLPQEIQEQLREDRKQLHTTMAVNDPYNIIMVNREGTRYFEARRICQSWSDNKGNYMPFGGGTYWSIAYGAILWDRRRNPVGEFDYEWVRSRSKAFGKSQNGTIIPKRVDTKKEALAIAKQIGIFE